MSEYKPCGGCGATHPRERCIGCLHEFGGGSKINAAPKHISEMDAAKRALVQQSIGEALLAIVVAQGRPVTLPIEHIERLSEQYRLVVGVDRAEGVVTLTAQKAELETAAPHEVAAIKGTIQ